ncbi:hypothetical protein [Stenomitos frigidus]|uniref:hypothetical protein n=1 Tax=Stenomitos frigidus TaxID=1886765 RepID=UPI0011B1D9D1|nr:hypothetical protein [Stenomitos frigidus]
MLSRPVGQSFHTITPSPSSIPTTHENSAIATGVIALLLPLIVALSIVARRHYHQRVMRQRIAKLERLWQLHYRQNIH